MTEYTTDELLRHCLRDGLIEGYTELPKSVAVWCGGKRLKMTPDQAKDFLSRLSRREEIPPDTRLFQA